MTIGFILLILVLLLGIANSVALFWLEERVGTGSWVLGILSFLHVLILLEFAMIWTKQLHHIPHFTAVSYALPFLIGPLAWSYVRKNTRGSFRYFGTFIFHFIPFFWLLFIQLGIYTDYAYSKEVFVKEQLYSGRYFSHPRHLWITIFQVLNMIVYTFLIYYEVYMASNRQLFREGKTFITKKMKRFALHFAFWTVLFMLSLIATSAGEGFEYVSLIAQLILALYVFGLTGKEILGKPANPTAQEEQS